MYYEWSELDNPLDVRNEFVYRFIDTNRPLFDQHIKQSTAAGYQGFLWEFFQFPAAVEEKEALRFIEQRKSVLFFFDNWCSYKSRTYIFPEKTWKLSAFQSSGSTLLDIMSKYSFVGLGDHREADIEPIPDEVYIFDETYTWYIALTTENLPNGERLCYAYGLNK